MMAKLAKGSCSVEGCDDPTDSHGLCRHHAYKFRTYGDPLAGGDRRPRGARPCSVVGCIDRARLRGMCRFHEYRDRVHGDPLTELPPRRKNAGLPCEIAGCEEPADTRGWCARHYQSYLDHGDPLRSKRRPKFADDERRFWSKGTLLPNGCGEWADELTDNGYAIFIVDGRKVRAHRWAYEHFIGPVPDGLDVDHMCHNGDESCLGGDSCTHRQCTMPYHLEPATRRLNSQRGLGGAWLKKRTHCVHGHLYDEANTLIDRRGYRHCRTCKNIAGREYQQRKRDAIKRGAVA